MNGQGQGLGLAGQGPAMVEQAVQMLIQGATPEQLLQAGIPAIVIEQAMAIVAQQMQQQVPQDAEMPGLAGMQ